MRPNILSIVIEQHLKSSHLWVWEVALPRYLSYPVFGDIAGLPGPREDI
jgi:hypothetical protein